MWWGPTPTTCHRSLTLATIIRDDYPLSLRIVVALLRTTCHRSLTLATATTIRSVSFFVFL